MQFLSRYRSVHSWLLAALWMLIGSSTSGQSVPVGFADALVMGGWSGPVGVTWDANGRYYVWEKRGRVWIVENGVRSASPLITLEQEVGNWGDHGMLGFALDPNFLSNGRIYLMYVVDRHHLLYFGTGQYDPFITEGNAATIVRIVRYTAIGPSYNSVDAASRTVLLGETAQTGAPILYNTHGAGSLAFGRDGTLLATIGEGACAITADVGSNTDSYWTAALAEGIIRPEENVGAFRSQMVNSLSGKVLRLDPNTGNGIPSNPFYDPTAPRAPRSRVWALGLRNPYRMTIMTGTGSMNAADGNPGTLIIGDVGWSTWEEMNVCRYPGTNFGWPLYEGMEAQTSYMAALTENKDAPNPSYDGITCSLPYYRFQDLLKQDIPVQVNGHPDPCNNAVQIPNSTRKFFHTRPAIDWVHGNQSRCGAFSGSTAVTFDLDAVGSPVPGPRFGGNAAIGGPWMASPSWPPVYQNSAFIGDYPGGWIRRLVLNANQEPVSVHDFASGLGAVNWIGQGPDGCLWYIKYNSTEIRRICYTQAVNLPPVVVATQSVQFGPGPLSVQFTGSGSSDPENGALTYSWNFGDGSPNSSSPDPTHVFTALPGIPTLFTVTLTVTDNQGQSVQRTLSVSVNNTPPVVNITSFANGAFYPVGRDTVFTLQASVTDAQHTAAQLSYAWVTTLVHNTHTHPGTPDATPTTTTVINGEGCDGQSYSYVVSLTVTDAAGLSTTAQRTLLPRCQAIAPTAIINASVGFGPGPLAVDLNGAASYDPGTIVSYLWDFGDGTSASGAVVQRIFTETGDRVVTLTVTDNDGLIGQATKVISVLAYDPPQCVGGAGSLLREFWSGLGGSSVLDLTNSPAFPNSPTGSTFPTLFQGPTNSANNYGSRFRGYIVAPTTGNYTFTLTADDAAAVYLSPNADPRFKALLCYVPGATGATEYDRYPTQVSASITLQAGIYYYVEMLHKEGSGFDHCALRWQTPTNGTLTIVPGSVLYRWQNCAPSVRVRALLQGPHALSNNLMRDDLRVAGVIPLTEPFTALGFGQVGGGGGETVNAARLSVTGANAIVDWVLVELRNKTTPSQIVATRSALLERDGDVVDVNGQPRLIFSIANDDYFVAIRHRNHLGAMTATATRLDADESAVDFTTSGSPTWGVGATTTLANGKRALWCGNARIDATLRYVGQNNDRDPILSVIGGSQPTNTISGYFKEDVDLNGLVRYVGSSNDRDPILSNIGGSVPTSIRLQQLP